MGDFQRALAFVLKREAGYSNRADDKGGPTNFGITQATYDRWLRAHDMADASVEHIPRAVVERIYTYEYWLGAAASQPWPLCLVIFDARVQHGEWARRVQLAVNALGGDQVDEPLAEDNAWGPKTAYAVRWRTEDGADPLPLAVAIVAERLAYYPKLDTFESNGAGWMNRMSALLMECRLD